MPVRLTETLIARAVREAAEGGARRDLADVGCPGLRLRVSPTGGKVWALACRDPLGSMRRYPLGAHPAIGVAEAREAARALHSQVKLAGADPLAERRAKREAARAEQEGIATLAALLDLYGAKQGQAKRSWPDCRRRIASVFAAHMTRPLDRLTARDLQLTADAHGSAASASAGVRYLRPALKWAAQRGYVGAELAAIHPPATVGRRDRVLSREELAAILPVLRASGDPHAKAMWFLLLTLARREEAGAATWRHIDLARATWTIPVTKNGQPHLVPLPHQAVALLRSIGPGAPDGVVFASEAGTRVQNWDRATKAVQAASGTAGWTRHDLRRTGATLLGEMGELPDIIEAALNHVSIRSALAATYNRSRYRPQVAAALQRLADALDGIEAGVAMVVPMRAKALADG